jgi:hypothetical protein
MAYRLITCPETAHLELIEYERDPLGLLVQACSHYRPPHCLRCPRTCASRLDRRERQDTLVDDRDRTGVDVAAWLRFGAQLKGRR